MSLSSLLPIIRSQFSRLKICRENDKVYKDECVYSFDSPFSDGGLYVNLSSLQGFGAQYVARDIAKGGVLYLHEKWTEVPKPTVTETTEQVTKLAIGVEGGFSAQSSYDVVKEHSLAVVDSGTLVTVALPCPELPEFVSNVIQSVIDHGGMRPILAASTWSADDELVESKYARTLVQLNAGKTISQDSSTWRCEMSGDTNNLWLNLSTGYIGGGRKMWDGSGGSGAALQHYKDTGCQYPLCVKLGTITPHSADVWSYAEDEDKLVIDPLLPEHLSHWGINIMQLKKTAQSFTEAEVALNMSYDWSKLMEGGDKIETVRGPGLVGIQNVGSSCYFNSVFQALFAVPEIGQRYYGQRDRILETSPGDPAADLGTQLSKLADAILTSHYIPTDLEIPASESVSEPSVAPTSLQKYAIMPRMLKSLIGQGHPEFSTGNQQDASEYFMHVLQIVSRHERTLLPRIADNGPATSALFEFGLESRFQCPITGQVRYVSGKQATENTLELRIPLDAALNVAEVERTHAAKKARVESQAASSSDIDDVKLHVPFEACLNTVFGSEIVEYNNPSVGHIVNASRTIKLKNFPRYLMIKLARYYVGPNWTQIKVDARVPMPENLDLNSYLARGLQPGEQEMPAVRDEQISSSGNATSNTTGASSQVPDESIVAQLMAMGFAENGCRKAAMTSDDVEEAMNWILVHMDDPDFNDPPATANASSTSSIEELSPAIGQAIDLITSMGYTEVQARAALRATDNNLERAVDWIFSHADDMDTAIAEVNTTSAEAPRPALEQSEDGNYSLVAVISHLGTNTAFGHYVCHVKQPSGQWVLFNDDRVGKSTAEKALEYGFMYLYARRDGPRAL